MPLSKIEQSRYAKQMALAEIGEAGQLKLKNASVLCIGAGGLGSALLPYLAAAGVGRIGIIDDDVVENGNLQRQVIYTPQDIGSKKVVAAKRYLNALNPEIDIQVYPDRFHRDTAADLMRHYDIAADCTDNLASRLITNAVCLQLDKPFVFAGISQYQGQCMLFHGGSGPCFSCVFPEMTAYDLLPDCNTAGVIGVLPGMLGIMQANMVLQHILQMDAGQAGRFYTLDMRDLQLRHYHVDKNPQCSVCVGGIIYSSDVA